MKLTVLNKPRRGFIKYISDLKILSVSNKKSECEFQLFIRLL
jgi:hypothetical protein